MEGSMQAAVKTRKKAFFRGIKRESFHENSFHGSVRGSRGSYFHGTLLYSFMTPQQGSHPTVEVHQIPSTFCTQSPEK